MKPLLTTQMNNTLYSECIVKKVVNIDGLIIGIDRIATFEIPFGD